MSQRVKSWPKKGYFRQKNRKSSGPDVDKGLAQSWNGKKATVAETG